KMNGSFNRQFSQADGAEDVKKYFGDSPVAKHGVCAAAGLFWIRHHLIHDRLYTNTDLVKDTNQILTTQQALRYRNQPLDHLLLQCGMKHQPTHLVQYKFGKPKSKHNGDPEFKGIAHFLCDSTGVNTISYPIPSGGRHVAVCYVDKKRNLHFSDVQKGDVTLPSPASKDWLTQYFEIILNKYGDITVSHFQPEWNERQFVVEERKLYADSLHYDPSDFDKSRSIAADDFELQKKSPTFLFYENSKGQSKDTSNLHYALDPC
ncbi:hypothetical protein ACR9PT_14325, partial [Piscirickettsia salmonis]